MIETSPISSELVLIGGGHANIQVVKSLAMKPIRGLRTTLVSDVLYSPYSGMLPGYLAGWYEFSEIHFDLRKICQKAGVRFIHDEVTGVNGRDREIRLKNRPALHFDLASINVGIVPKPLPSAMNSDRIYPLKPIGKFLKGWRDFLARVQNENELRIAVIGGGAAGVETSLMIARKLRPKAPRIHLISKSETLLPGQSRPARNLAETSLVKNGIRVRKNEEARSFDGRSLTTSETSLDIDYLFIATEAEAPAWFAGTDLAKTEDGFLLIENDLRVQGQENIFAAGDCTQMIRKRLPKAGVYAVRQGQLLKQNLRRRLFDRDLKDYVPQKRTLFLINSGDKTAVASYGALAVQGRWVWRWKDRIDRKFMRRFQTMPSMSGSVSTLPLVEPVNTCGGCGAKVASDLLHEVLAKLKAEGRYLFSTDLGQEDCSIHAFERPVLHNLDALKAFIDDPYLMGRIATEHALNDIYAMGGAPAAAQALVTLPPARAEILKNDLFQVMSGIASALTAAGTALSGGHTMEGAEFSVGLSVLGEAAKPLKKSSARDGDILILTKPLGSGALLAANMAGAAEADWIEGLLNSMLRNNSAARDILLDHQVTALTDVTGFGLAGHLLEMLKGNGLEAEIHAPSLPVFAGFSECIGKGFTGALSLHTRRGCEPFLSGEADQPKTAALYDPQTSGGFLAAVPTARARGCLEKLKEAGFKDATMIGRLKCAENKKNQGGIALVSDLLF